MNAEQQDINYKRIAKVIAYINQNHQQQPSLEELAAYVNLSPYHFQRLFKEWVGVSPKQFLRYVTLNYAKYLLKEEALTLFDTSFESGFSSTSRLHDLFIKIEGMTPAEYKNDGQNLKIDYSFFESQFGLMLIASTHKGVCFMHFIATKLEGIALLKQHFSKAQLLEQETVFHRKARAIYTQEWSEITALKLHLKGSDFQLKVWESLLKIPQGELSTYQNIANEIERPKASRAIGTAIGKNPVALLIPCHRVIQTSGKLGGYMWGLTRKQALLAWELSKKHE
ncbi:MAG: methylated-DNA--[protein]-cysteine S-methyltransferase [Flavobacteriales bacterium]|jgi:AraC family transcriptional regulator of adaptative response/methylated-DNA-[protein]-cysteine methyltransferase|nr:methylated-DNA--[protein]-cysteine S-methyltransferase [Flavobacteriales bacterium]